MNTWFYSMINMIFACVSHPLRGVSCSYFTAIGAANPQFLNNTADSFSDFSLAAACVILISTNVTVKT